MLIHAYKTDLDLKPELIAKTEVDALNLMIAAESREHVAREKRRVWTEGAVPFWAQEMVKAMESHQPLKELERHATNAAMAAWLADSIYSGLTAEQFAVSDLVFTLLPSGAVKYDRMPAGTLAHKGL